MEALKFGKGVWATKTGSSMAYSDTNDRYKPLPFNVERDSIATRVNKEGLIEVVGHDKLRIDYTDTDKGVALLENTSTNLQTYSSDLASVYVPTEVTQTSNYGISPDGTQTSTRVVLDNLSTSRSVETLTGVLVSGTTYTFSCYYKGIKGEITYMYFLSSTGGTNVSKQILFTGEWQRESITFTAGSASNYTYIIDVRQGSSTATDFQVWGAQVEANSVASSYIPTSGSAVQRAADVANNAGNSEVFNDSEGVLFADIAALADDGTFRVISINGTPTNVNEDRIQIYFRDTANIINFGMESGNSSQFFLQFPLDVKLNNKLALKYSASSCSFWINGFEVGEELNKVMPNDLSRLDFTIQNGGDNFYGKTKEIGYYDAVLTDSELEYLTSYRSLSELVKELNLNTL